MSGAISSALGSGDSATGGRRQLVQQPRGSRAYLERRLPSQQRLLQLADQNLLHAGILCQLSQTAGRRFALGKRRSIKGRQQLPHLGPYVRIGSVSSSHNASRPDHRQRQADCDGC